MDKSIKRLVGLILEEIEKQNVGNDPIFFGSSSDVLKFIQSRNGGNGVDMDMSEMANIRYSEETLPDYMYIPVSELSPKSVNVPDKIVCLDPATNEMVEGVIIGNKVRTWPEAPELKFLAFVNYGKSLGIDRKDYTTQYVLIPENIFRQHKPRTKDFGMMYTKKDLETSPEGETEEEKKKRLKLIKSNNEGYVKRHVIYPSINHFFSQPKILNRLDISLIPEIWATSMRTERTTNREKRFKWGDNGRSLNIEFYSVKDINDIDSVLDDIFNTRMDLEDGVENRERKMSKTKPREYSNYIYRRGGKWNAIQRIYNADEFKKAGEYTKVLKLLKKNIQKGEKGVNTMSRLVIEGDVVDDRFYELRAKFTVELNYRTISGDEPQSAGELIDPIYVSVRKELPEEAITDGDFTVKKYKGFFGTNGQDGIFTELFKKMGDEMMSKINPDEVLNKITELATPADIE